MNIFINPYKNKFKGFDASFFCFSKFSIFLRIWKILVCFSKISLSDSSFGFLGKSFSILYFNKLNKISSLGIIFKSSFILSSSTSSSFSSFNTGFLLFLDMLPLLLFGDFAKFFSSFFLYFFFIYIINKRFYYF